ncbi:hypothetical protein H6G97_34200 [Nostoc flagelliforme FACHB-838]|uniref:Tetratricopeptide repeat protein n=1 Tax=Nostoc flagelliforme FACHB-838 TaxID=2692904 RepID=A0ABR8DYT6_9NOSO|nr:hypothetical protein [Nostoc flagelliforme]MBD2534303.1 hypothetical protein [Nostoc flagelliforme FACHB-838]
MMLIVPKSTVQGERKVFQAQIAAIASILIFSNFSSAWGQRPSVATSDSIEQECAPVARIINGDLHKVVGSQVCKQDKLQSANGATVEVFCYADGNILQLYSGIIGEQCSTLLNSPSQDCVSRSRGACLKVKGPNEHENRPTLITPYSPLILNTRPTLSWTPVRNASGYIVQIKGTGVEWSKEVNSTSLLYPKDEPAMRSGIIYEVNVLAKMAEQDFIGKSSILMIMHADKAQQAKAIIERIQTLNLSPDELAVDLNHLYKANDLLTEAIEVLKERIQARTQNPTIYRALGDRYLDVGLPQLASPKYRIAMQYAKLGGDLNELAKAQAGLELSLRQQP